MKLVYCCLFLGALVDAKKTSKGRKGASWKTAIQARPISNQNQYLCKERRDSFFSHGKVDLEKYQQTIDPKLQAYAEILNNETPIEEHCLQALDNQICTQFNDMSLEQIREVFETEFPRGSDCGSKAAEWINQLTFCQLCVDILDEVNLEENIQHLANRNIQNGESESLNFESWGDSLMVSINNKGSNLRGISDEEYDKIIEPLHAGDVLDQKESISEMVFNGTEITDITRSVAGIQSIASQKQFFRQVGKAVWNVIVSGGPEYCKDMIPNFPKISLPQNHPNYPIIQKLNQNCILMHSIIKGTRCFCLYLLWGCSNFRQVKRCDVNSWQKKHGSTAERKYCWYFSNLKGGIHKPKDKPMNPTCTTIHLPVDMLLDKKPEWPS